MKEPITKEYKFHRIDHQWWPQFPVLGEQIAPSLCVGGVETAFAGLSRAETMTMVVSNVRPRGDNWHYIRRGIMPYDTWLSCRVTSIRSGSLALPSWVERLLERDFGWAKFTNQVLYVWCY